MPKRLEQMTNEDRKVLLNNLNNVNGSKPFELWAALGRVEENARDGTFQPGQYRDLAVLLRHFRYPIYPEYSDGKGSLPLDFQRQYFSYGEPPKDISAGQVREILNGDERSHTN